MLNQETIDAISQKIAQSYRRAFGDSLQDVLLYGSCARGDYDGESDIDYVAIVQGERTALKKKLKAVWQDAADIGLEYDIMVSPTMIPAADYEKYKDGLPYYRNIHREGKRIV